MGLKPGWRSGSSQMNAIIAMIAYYRESGDQSILPVIRRVKNGMMLPVSEGGTTAVSPEGGIWIEEFPTDPPSLALGSFINSIIALHEVAELFPDDGGTRNEFDAAVSSLKASLRHYDSGNWTYVYRWPGLGRPALADEMYGPAFPRLMQELAEITKDPLILATSLRWRSFYEDVNLRSQAMCCRTSMEPIDSPRGCQSGSSRTPSRAMSISFVSALIPTLTMVPIISSIIT